jgi:hypothetical protein
MKTDIHGKVKQKGITRESGSDRARRARIIKGNEQNIAIQVKVEAVKQQRGFK